MLFNSRVTFDACMYYLVYVCLPCCFRFDGFLIGQESCFACSKYIEVNCISPNDVIISNVTGYNIPSHQMVHIFLLSVSVNSSAVVQYILPTTRFHFFPPVVSSKDLLRSSYCNLQSFSSHEIIKRLKWGRMIVLCFVSLHTTWKCFKKCCFSYKRLSGSNPVISLLVTLVNSVSLSWTQGEACCLGGVAMLNAFMVAVYLTNHQPVSQSLGSRVSIYSKDSFLHVV